MKIHLALYDPSHLEGNSYWTWHDRSIPTSVLDRFYYDIAAKRKPASPNSLRVGDLIGGAARIDAECAVAYRFFDGGSDSRNRPERFFLLAAFLNGGESVRLDALSLLESARFNTIGKIGRHACPVPAPAQLTVEWPETDSPPPPDDVLECLSRTGSAEITGVDALRAASVLFAALPSGVTAAVDMERFGGSCRVVASLLKRENTKLASPPPRIAGKGGGASARRPPPRPLPLSAWQKVIVYMRNAPATVFVLGFILGALFAAAAILLTQQLINSLWKHPVTFDSVVHDPYSGRDAGGTSTALPEDAPAGTNQPPTKEDGTLTDNASAPPPSLGVNTRDPSSESGTTADLDRRDDGAGSSAESSDESGANASQDDNSRAQQMDGGREKPD